MELGLIVFDVEMFIDSELFATVSIFYLGEFENKVIRKLL